MLESLTIKNTAIIDFITVNFTEGMNCMTGETGAGKSIIIDAICCLMGERVSRDSIRRGATEAQVTGVFSVQDRNAERINAALDELGVTSEEDGTLILYRAYNENGKNTCRINDRAVTLGGLKKIGELLVDVHGQHDNHSLMMPSSHINLLDAYAGIEYSREFNTYRIKLQELRSVENELEELSGDPQKRLQLIDLLTYQAEEIYNAHLKPGEEAKLLEKQKLIDNASRISGEVSAALNLIEGDEDFRGGGISDLLSKAASGLSGAEKFSEKLKSAGSQLKEAYYIVEDVKDTLRECLESLSYDPEEAAATEERLDLIYNLKKKYGGSEELIIEFGDNAQSQLERLRDSEARVSELNRQKAGIYAELGELAAILHQKRCEAGGRLTEAVVAALSDMDMGKVRFGISDDYIAESREFGPRGLDNIEFLISANPGEALKPLAKTASGGELSRIMLALKSCLAEADQIPVLIFDEIDTGISGRAAGAVAEKFIKVSRLHQLICVSHLAQIAAISDTNVIISKTYDEDSVRTEAVIAEDEDKVREVARLIDGGELTEITLAHSRELIERMRSRAQEL